MGKIRQQLLVRIMDVRYAIVIKDLCSPYLTRENMNGFLTKTNLICLCYNHHKFGSPIKIYQHIKMPFHFIYG
jgi:hypothetical protein